LWEAVAECRELEGQPYLVSTNLKNDQNRIPALAGQIGDVDDHGLPNLRANWKVVRRRNQ
jgi:hypothetical protein